MFQGYGETAGVGIIRALGYQREWLCGQELRVLARKACGASSQDCSEQLHDQYRKILPSQVRQRGHAMINVLAASQ